MYMMNSVSLLSVLQVSFILWTSVFSPWSRVFLRNWYYNQIFFYFTAKLSMYGPLFPPYTGFNKLRRNPLLWPSTRLLWSRNRHWRNRRMRSSGFTLTFFIPTGQFHRCTSEDTRRYLIVPFLSLVSFVLQTFRLRFNNFEEPRGTLRSNLTLKII